VPGVRDPAAFNLIGQPNLVIRIDRAKAARYGISVLCAPFTGRERRFRFWHELGHSNRRHYRGFTAGKL
jgi:hypothetical protein